MAGMRVFKMEVHKRRAYKPLKYLTYLIYINVEGLRIY